jgi:hydroxyethylthiazole kinase-like uncharacterized protein yjeF
MPSARFAPARPIYPVAGIRAVEARALPGAVPPLMERAGAAAAALALRLLDGPGSVLVACGPGNNGGDGFVVARHLKAAGLRVVVAFAGEPAKLPADASAAHAAWLEHGGSTSAELPPPPPGGWSLVVDALFGIGLQRPLDGRYADWIATLNAQPCPRLALDIPSGLDADSGRRLGPCFAASHTVSFIALKPGLLTLDGPDQCGELHLQEIDVDAEASPPRRATRSPRPSSPAGWRPGAQQPQGQLRRRRADRRRAGHGRRRHPGRPGRGHLGAGRVLVGLLDPATLPVDILRPELMFRSAPELLAEAGIAAFAVGPGSASRTPRGRWCTRPSRCRPSSCSTPTPSTSSPATRACRPPSPTAAGPRCSPRTPPRRPACSAPPPPTCRPTASPPPAGWPGS